MSAPEGYGSIPAEKLAQREEETPLANDKKLLARSRWFSVTTLTAYVVVVAVCLAVATSMGSKWSPDAISALVTHPMNKKNTGQQSNYPHKTHPETYHKHSYLLDDDYDEEELFYNDQFVDHIFIDTEHHPDKIKRFPHRYYKKSKYWKGPGYPIILIVGGEDSLDPPMLYPFVNEGLAKEFNAFVISPEHRFYGKSQPVRHPTVHDLVKYLSPDQAILDFVNILQFLRDELGCSPEPTHHKYCPVITVGSSYPGFLSSMMRFRFPDYVDIAYAASSPLKLYSQEVDANAYYDKVSEVAENASPGCADAVRSTLFAVRDELLANYTSVLDAAEATGFCIDSFPRYMESIPEFISEIVTYLPPAIWADFNMFYYPPGPDTAVNRACAVFQDESVSPIERLANFFYLRGEVEYGSNTAPDCFDLSLELPDGPHSRIRGADNSGTGGGFTGEIWEFQCCKDLIIRAGYSEKSMFIPRPFNYTWHKEHCNIRFPGAPVEPYRMVEQWGFNTLGNTSRILFTNGMHDGWSTSSILEAHDNPHSAVINFPNGAHHSELGGEYPNPRDTPDIHAGFQTITEVLAGWLQVVYSQRKI